jgi:hypothetical protein
MKKTLLSPQQAFKAMTVFLGEYYDRTGGEGELASILGDIQINQADDRPMDPAAWADWIAAVERVLKDRIKAV